MTLEELMAMPLHSRLPLETGSILRVAGGWLYERLVGSTGTSVFVLEPGGTVKVGTRKV